ncbi:MAG: PAS domain S-box protein [Porphyrobacter sp.]|nr:PAS domain S-box protein [Porphyrobacter sp.]
MSGDSGGLDDVFPGDSEMSRLMRSHDWSSTSLGNPEGWPDALKIPLRMLLTSRFEMWLGWGPDLRFFYNDAYIPTLGIKHPTMLGRPFREVWSEVYEDVAEQVDRVRGGQATWNKELLLLLERSGYPEETYHSFSYSPLYAADGNVEGLLCIVREDTAPVLAERRMETLRRLGTALVGADDTSTILEATRSAFAANRRDFPFALLRLPRGVASSEERIATDASLGSALDELAQSADDPAGTIFELEQDVPWPMGDWDRLPREAIAIPIPDPTGSTLDGSLILGLNPYRPNDPEILSVARLVAAQIAGAFANVSALHSERRRADRIWTVSRDLMIVVDAQGHLQSVSPAWTRILGHHAEDVVGRHFSEFMHPDDVHESGLALARAIADHQLTNFESRYVTVDGNVRWIEWHTSMEDGLVYAYGRDVTSRLLAEEALSKSQEQFRHLVQGVTDYAIYMIDPEGRVSSWNEGARRIKGYEPEEIIGRHFSRFYTDEDRASGEPERALETARREGRLSAEGWRVKKDGTRFRASVVIDTIRDDAGTPIGFAKITRDITEREQTQRELEQAREALFQSQKMEAIGQLTGGIAHDFNNLLMAVMSSLDLLRKRIPEDPLTQRLIKNAMEGAQRGATLTQRMLAFARRQDLKVGSIDVSQLLSGMGDLVQRSIGPGWPISVNLPLGLSRVRVDANQLEMALLNLIVNARDAMPSGGPIAISATKEVGSGEQKNGLAAGEYVRLVVADMGEGMDEDTLLRATEPFFTTKGVGKGTGLGLSMVHGMAQQIGGAFEIQSAIGEGTSAVLWLPVDVGEVSGEKTVESNDLPGMAKRLSILVVDDDPLILMNTAALVEDLGHSAKEAASGADALIEFQAESGIEVVITDQAMPGMTGTELIAALDAIRPVPVVIASGYGEGLEGLSRRVVRLTKPFNQVQLARAIAEATELPENAISLDGRN